MPHKIPGALMFFQTFKFNEISSVLTRAFKSVQVVKPKPAIVGRYPRERNCFVNTVHHPERQSSACLQSAISFRLESGIGFNQPFSNTFPNFRNTKQRLEFRIRESLTWPQIVLANNIRKNRYKTKNALWAPSREICFLTCS